jgi:hypothetical protein
LPPYLELLATWFAAARRKKSGSWLQSGGVVIGVSIDSRRRRTTSIKSVDSSTFDGSEAGDQREVVGVQDCRCPAAKFTMGSPRNEPERS